MRNILTIKLENLFMWKKNIWEEEGKVFIKNFKRLAFCQLFASDRKRGFDFILKQEIFI